MNNASTEDVASELVDSILLGTADRGARKSAQLDRDAFYQKIHARHDADPSPQAAPTPARRFFNDYQRARSWRRAEAPDA
jgi:hypothetical protein